MNIMKTVVSRIASAVAVSLLALVISGCEKEIKPTTSGKIPVQGISVSATATEILKGGSGSIKVTITPANASDKSVSFSSDNTDVVSVDAQGVFVGLAPGEATITVRTNDGGKTATVKVTVLRVYNEEEEKVKTALLKIYDAMDGPNWKITKKWDASGDLKNWQGVHWENGKLWLEFNGDFGLNGEFPDVFDDLVSCELFMLQDEPGVTGTLPPSFSKLHNLGYLFIVGTSMTSLPDIFADIPLIHVYISNNGKMSGSVPESLGASDRLMGDMVTNLGYPPGIKISSSNFTGSIPESWLRLGIHVDLYDNTFSGQIPDYFYSDEGAGFWINMFINSDSSINSSLYRETDPYIVKGYDIPAYWPKRGIKDVLTGKPIPYEEIVSDSKLTVLFTWGSWCNYSAALLPQLKKMYEKYHGEGLEVITRPIWGDKEGERTIKSFLVENGYDKWYNFSCDDNEIGFNESLAMGANVPSVVIMDSRGKIVFSSARYTKDPLGRFGHDTFMELIPFLEECFGPMDDEEEYSSTDYSSDGHVILLQEASVGKGINIVFLGDAYTDKNIEDGTYDQLMAWAKDEFFKIEPYKTFMNRFNVYYVRAVSKNGKTGNGYSTAFGTISDPAENSIAISDLGLEKCYEYALKVSGIKDKKNLLICVLVNSPGLRGITSMSESLQSGVAFISSGFNNPSAFGPVIRHEAGGHGFAFLADEYSSQSGAPDQAFIDDYNRLYSKYGWYSNVDFTDDPAKVKWSAFLADGRYNDEVGIFEGGGTFSKGVYRPSPDSMMNNNYEYYNAPSRWAIYKRIMELSGETASFDAFLQYDAINRGNAVQSARPPLKAAANVQRELGAPPVIRP